MVQFAMCIRVLHLELLDDRPNAFRCVSQSAVWNSLAEYDLRDELTKLSIQSLVIHGTHDPVSIDTARETANLLGAEFVEFEESGHAPHVEERDKFVSTLDAFLPRAPRLPEIP